MITIDDRKNVLTTFYQQKQNHQLQICAMQEKNAGTGTQEYLNLCIVHAPKTLSHASSDFIFY